VGRMGRPIPSRDRWEVLGINNDSIPGLCQNTMIPPILPPDTSLLDVTVLQKVSQGQNTVTLRRVSWEGTRKRQVSRDRVYQSCKWTICDFITLVISHESSLRITMTIIAQLEAIDTALTC
jgi:hypothetical protein